MSILWKILTLWSFLGMLLEMSRSFGINKAPQSLHENALSRLAYLDSIVVSTAVVATVTTQTAKASDTMISSDRMCKLGACYSPAKPTRVRLPLYKFDGVLCTTYDLNGENMRAIVDTGSPFLVVPSVCTEAWGCLSKKVYLVAMQALFLSEAS